MTEVRTLVVDDEPQLRLTVAAALDGRGFELTMAESGEEGLAAARRQPFDVALVDLNLPGMSGLELLERLGGLPEPPELVVLTGHPELDTAVEAMKLGAFDYISKPFDPLRLVAVLTNAATKRRLHRENSSLRRVVASQRGDGRPPVVADSPAMRRALAVAERVARSNAPVLLQGEPGSGKGMMARWVHAASPRADEPLLHLNCSALEERLLDSELFGYERGAFAGASESKLGLLQVADGGTLVLDDVHRLGATGQAQLLQVLESGELRRVGARSTARVDVRILAATHVDLEAEASAGRFRRDLTLRLGVVRIELPPLRRRREDVAGLAELFLERHRPAGEAKKAISSELLAALEGYSWPGNVRELANVIEGMILMAPGDELGPGDLPPAIASALPFTGDVRRGDDEPLSLAEVQRAHIVRVLRHTKGQKAAAARLLGIDVKTLGRKIKAYEIDL